MHLNICLKIENIFRFITIYKYIIQMKMYTYNDFINCCKDGDIDQAAHVNCSIIGKFVS